MMDAKTDVVGMASSDSGHGCEWQSTLSTWGSELLAAIVDAGAGQ